MAPSLTCAEEAFRACRPVAGFRFIPFIRFNEFEDRFLDLLDGFVHAAPGLTNPVKDSSMLIMSLVGGFPRAEVLVSASASGSEYRMDRFCIPRSEWWVWQLYMGRPSFGTSRTLQVA